jgi:hypothetical protein
VFQSLKANTGSVTREAELYLFSPKAKTVTFRVSQPGKTASAEEVEGGSIGVFPNPSSGFFSIKSPVPIERIRLYNHLGELIKSTDEKAMEYRFNLSDQAKGVYYVSIVLNNKLFRRKIVII